MSQNFEKYLLSLYRKKSFLGYCFVIGRLKIFDFSKVTKYVPRGANVLDIGCGSGIFLLKLAFENTISNGIGVDTSEAAINLAKMVKEDLEKRQSCFILSFNCDNNSLNDLSDNFEVVSMIDVMHHLDKKSQNEVLITAWSKIIPGGYLIYKDMSEIYIFEKWMNILHDLIISRQFINYFPTIKIEEFALQNKGDVIVKYSWRQLWYRHELFVIRKS